MRMSQPTSQVRVFCIGFDTGLVGTIQIQIVKRDGTVAVTRSTTGITELVAGSGIYVCTLSPPQICDDYLIVWDSGTVSPDTVAVEELIVRPYAPDAYPYG